MAPSISLSISLARPNFVISGTDPVLPVTSGLQLQLDGKDTDTLTQDVPGRVRLWADKSPGGKDALQNTAANQPFVDATGLNGRQSLRGAGSQWMVTGLNLNSIIGGTGIMSYFMVWKAPPNFSVFRGIMGAFQLSPTVSRFSMRYNTAGSNEFGWGSVFENLSTPNSPNINDNVYTSFIASGGGPGFSIWNNGVSRVVSHPYSYSANTKPVQLFNTPLNTSPNSIWVGNIGEFLIYDRAVTNGERLQIESYFQEKWGL